MYSGTKQSKNTRTLRDYICSEIATNIDDIGVTKTCSAVQFALWNHDGVQFNEALGMPHLVSSSHAMSGTTPMDIASVTKALVTATLVMQAIDERRVRWNTPVSRWYGRESLDSMTVLHLLNHTSGLPAWHDFHTGRAPDPNVARANENRCEIIRNIVDMALSASSGREYVYSDLGYILLTDILEQIFEAPFEELARQRIFEPLGMDNTRYVSVRRGDTPLTTAAATEVCGFRQRTIVGTVHDENAHIMGGVAGHAGVFSTAEDLLKFARHLLNIDRGHSVNNPIVSRDVLQFCWSRNATNVEGASHVGGWDTPSGKRSSAGRGFRPSTTVGHLGFTGTSVWIEREKQVVAVLLTNRTFPNRDNDRIKDMRITVHELVLSPNSS